jgi:hypothetical protein
MVQVQVAAPLVLLKLELAMPTDALQAQIHHGIQAWLDGVL